MPEVEIDLPISCLHCQSYPITTLSPIAVEKASAKNQTRSYDPGWTSSVNI